MGKCAKDLHKPFYMQVFSPYIRRDILYYIFAI